MELDFNITLLLIAVIACIAVFLATILKGIQKNMDSIVKYADEKRQGEAHAVVAEQEKSKFKTFWKNSWHAITTGIGIILLIMFENYDKIIDFVNPNPIEDKIEKLSILVDQIQPSIEINLPDSIEQREDVKKIRSMQDKITYFNLTLKLLQEKSNNKNTFNSNSAMVQYYLSIVTDFNWINRAFGQVTSEIRALPNVYMYMNASQLMDFLEIQNNYNKIQKKTIEGLTPMASAPTKLNSKDMRKFNKIMTTFVDECYYQTDKQIEIIQNINIALNLALLDIKGGTIHNSDFPIKEQLPMLSSI